MIGGVAGELLHVAPCSVLVTRPASDPESFPRSIVVGIDGSAAADAAMAAAQQLARRLEGPLRVVTALRGKDVDLAHVHLRAPFAESVDAHPVEALVTASLTTDLVVVGSRGLHGLAALGSVSERVAHQAKCSVLVVRSTLIPVTERPYAASGAEVARALGTHPDRGLAADEAARRLERYGPNAPERRRRPPYLRLALRQLLDPLVALLIVAAAISVAIGDTSEGIAIAAILVLNGALGFWQEAGADRAILALSQAFTQTALVVRDGSRRELPAQEVVPGRRPARRRGRAGRSRRPARRGTLARGRRIGAHGRVSPGCEAGRAGRRRHAARRAGVDDLRRHGRDPRPRTGARLRDRAADADRRDRDSRGDREAAARRR